MIHLSAWLDHPSLHQTPTGHAWDVFHQVVLAAECQGTPLIKNVYGGTAWSSDALEAMSRETAWMASTKDASALEWAERTLVERHR